MLFLLFCGVLFFALNYFHQIVCSSASMSCPHFFRLDVDFNCRTVTVHL
jgi:hypothetical protein